MDLLAGAAQPEATGRIGRRRQRRRTRLVMAAGVLGVVVLLSGAVALASVVTQRDSSIADGGPAPTVSPPSSFAASPPEPTDSTSPTAPTSSTSPTALATPTRRATATATPTTKPVEVRPSAPVTVLNASAVRGLAARSAARVRTVGFVVTGVANYRGGYDHTTICYEPGYADQAWLLAGRLRGMQNVVPAPAGLPGRTPLSLVVTEDFGD